MVDQVIILVGPGSENDCTGRFCRCFPDPVKDFLSLLKEFFPVSILSRLPLPDRFADDLRGNPESILHKNRQLALPVCIRVPEKDRHVVFDVPAVLGIIGVFDDQRESFDDPAHGDTGGLRIL